MERRTTPDFLGTSHFSSAASISSTVHDEPSTCPSAMSLTLGKRDGESETWAKLDGMLEWDRSPGEHRT